MCFKLIPFDSIGYGVVGVSPIPKYTEPSSTINVLSHFIWRCLASPATGYPSSVQASILDSVQFHQLELLEREKNGFLPQILHNPLKPT